MNLNEYDPWLCSTSQHLSIKILSGLFFSLDFFTWRKANTTLKQNNPQSFCLRETLKLDMLEIKMLEKKKHVRN